MPPKAKLARVPVFLDWIQSLLLPTPIYAQRIGANPSAVQLRAPWEIEQ